MPVLPTRIHGLFDYFVGMVLVGLPWLLEFESAGPETLVFTVAGTVLILYNLITSHELGLVRVIPMPLHFALDTILGTFLAVAPWVFDFAESARRRHLLFGILLLGSAFLTRSSRDRAAHVAW